MYIICLRKRLFQLPCDNNLSRHGKVPASIRSMHGNLPPEHRWKVRDGAYLWIRDELELVRDSEGNPKEMVGVCLDISRRRLDDEELKFETGRVLKEIGSECGTIMRGRSI